MADDLIAGRYRVERPLGRGSFGEVLKVKDLRLGQDVALKLISGSVDATARAAFLREAQALGGLRHPSIVSVLASGEAAEGRSYIAYEYVDGSDLGAVLRQQPPRLEDALVVLLKVSEALDAAHGQNIIHRDIKPSNVLLPRVGGRWAFDRAKLTDFGLAGRLEGTTSQTQTGMVFGTVNHMSPEQAKGERQSVATDTWGLGALLYEMMYGQVPFRADNLPSTLFAIIYKEVVLPQAPPLLPEVSRFLLACLEKDPGARPRDPTAEIRRLRAALSEEGEAESSGPTLSGVPPVPARPSDTGAFRVPAPASPRPRAATSSPSRPTTRPTQTRAAPSSTSRVKVFLAAGLGLLLVGAAAVLLLRHPPGRTVAGVLIGFALIVAGGLAGQGLRMVLARRRSAIEQHAGQLLRGAKDREALTQSIALELDSLIVQCRAVDARILATSIAIMVEEYSASAEARDRQAALMNAVQLLEKLMVKLSPWYVRYEKLLAAAVALVGVVSGIAKLVESLAHVRGPAG